MILKICRWFVCSSRNNSLHLSAHLDEGGPGALHDVLAEAELAGVALAEGEHVAAAAGLQPRAELHPLGLQHGLRLHLGGPPALPSVARTRGAALRLLPGPLHGRRALQLRGRHRVNRS